MNDVKDQTETSNFHETDWEHVTIQIEKTGVEYTPKYVNFYVHEGGHTVSAQDCWWSFTASNSYSGVDKGYGEGRSHLHVWLAANAHASYNRLDNVYKFDLNGQTFEQYVDNVDYYSSGYDLYFEYDYLEKLGEIELNNSAHGHTYLAHYIPKKNSKYWLAYFGRMGGQWWNNSFLATPGPLMPPYDRGSGKSHEYYIFSFNLSVDGFGNEQGANIPYLFLQGDVTWVSDSPTGD